MEEYPHPGREGGLGTGEIREREKRKEEGEREEHVVNEHILTNKSY